MNQLQKRLHDARLAVERWLLVTVFRYPPDLAIALQRAHNTRLELDRLLGAFAKERQQLERDIQALREMIWALVCKAGAVRAQREQLAAHIERGVAPAEMLPFIADLQRQEDELFTKAHQRRSLMTEACCAAAKLAVVERCIRIAAEPVLH